MWMTSFLGIELYLNDRRRPKTPCAAGARPFVRYWWIHSKAARNRLNARHPADPGSTRRSASL
jgi:hypothetical protein